MYMYSQPYTYMYSLVYILHIKHKGNRYCVPVLATTYVPFICLHPCTQVASALSLLCNTQGMEDVMELYQAHSQDIVSGLKVRSAITL